MEARNVKVSLETAKRWYEQGGEFKEMALSAFTEAELNPVRNEWDSKFIGVKIAGYYIAQVSEIRDFEESIANKTDINLFKTEKQAKSALAYAQLTQLMALPEYNGDWVPDWSDYDEYKYLIKRNRNGIETYSFTNIYCPISFKSEEIRDKFIENNLDLLKEYFELD